jgi:hypothetical protein
MPDEHEEFPSEASPPPGLMRKQRHVFFWLGIALLLGALVALFFLGFAAD